MALGLYKIAVHKYTVKQAQAAKAKRASSKGDIDARTWQGRLNMLGVDPTGMQLLTPEARAPLTFATRWKIVYVVFVVSVQLVL